MTKKAEEAQEKDLEKALDESLETLQKAADGDTISKSAEEESAKGKSEEDEDAKGEEEEAKGKSEEDENAKDKKDEDKDEGEDAKGKKEEEEAKGEEDDEEEGFKKKGMKKSIEEKLAKSEAVQNAVEVSKFLKELVKSLADIVGEQSYRIARLEKSNRTLGQALAKSVGAQNDMLKSFGDSIETIGGRPMPRKAVDGKAVTTLEKGFRNSPEKGSAQELSKSEVASKMADLEMAGKVPAGSTSKFEMTGEMAKSVESLVLGGDKA